MGNAKETVDVYEKQERGEPGTESDLDVGESHKKPAQEWRQRLRRCRFRPASLTWKRARWFWISLIVFGVLVGAAVAVWFALINALISRLSPQPLDSGVQQIVAKWKSPGDAQNLAPWPVGFSRDIYPVPCHSHNDYWRKVPLFSALAAGCVSVEGDIWFHDDSDDLRVGHNARTLSTERTLKSLYIDPIMRILEEQNKNNSSGETVGVFETAPNQTLVLLLDFKTDGPKTWPLLQTHLRPLREKGWLTHWNATTKSRMMRPVTVVGTGNAPFDLITRLETRDVFMDAPLDVLDSRYTAENSYYASVSMRKTIGTVHRDLNVHQIEVLDKQVGKAEAKGLVSRYWDTPSWPMTTRNRVWATLVEHGVGVLNVDRLETATRWDWRWCTVAGLNLCG